MDREEAKARFIQSWGALGSAWGVNRTMAQIHALLLVSTEPLSTEQIMEELSISRGNANMNIRTLIDWGIVHKELKPGERKEFFTSEKDVWEIARQVARERRRREMEPLLRTLTEVKQVQGSDAETMEFKRMIGEIEGFAKEADGLLDKFDRSGRNWFYSKLLKLVR